MSGKDLKRQSNENEYQYLFRVDDLIRSGKYLNWQAVVDTVNNELYGDDYDLYKTESAYRKKCKAARDFYEAFFRKAKKNIFGRYRNKSVNLRYQELNTVMRETIGVSN